MSTILCKGCGRMTNSATCKYSLKNMDTGADFCYAAWENDHWVKGCAPDIDLTKTDKYEKMMYDFAQGLYEKSQN